LFLADLLLPTKQPSTSSVNVLTEIAAQVSSQGAELATRLGLAEQCAQPVMPLSEKIFADIAEKVKVTGQNGNFEIEVLAKQFGRFGHCPAQIANNGARGAKTEYGFSQPRKDRIRPFGRYFPRAKYPLAPAGESNQ
jgi:hypothetical protein